MRQKHIPLILLSFFSLLLVHSCISPPKDIVAPSWDVPFNFPITDSTIVLKDMIDDDSTIVVSDDPASLGVLYFKQEETIDPFMVDSNLTIDGFSFSDSKVIGAISIENVDPVELDILLSQWAPTLVPGDTMVVPETENDLEIPFPQIDAFSFVTLDEGTLKIVIENRLPFQLELRGIKIKNAVGGETIANHVGTIVLPPQTQDSVSFDLTNKTIEDSLIYVGTIYTPGSGGGSVIIPTNAGTKVKGSFNDLVIAAVEAVLPEQDPFSVSDVVSIGDSNEIEEAIFSDGSFEIILNNDLDVAITLSLNIDNLQLPDGSSYTETISLDRKETNKIVSYPDLSNWKIVTLNPGVPTNTLNYSATVNTVVSTEPSLISKDDSVGIEVNFENASLQYIEGRMAPVEFDITESDIDFDLGDIKETFNFDSIMISKPTMLLELASTVNFDVELNGIISGESDNLKKELSIQLDLPARVETTFDLNDFGFTDFINSFTTKGEIPNTFTLSGKGIVNPEYKIGSVDKSDSVSGGFAFEVPFDFGIAGGTFRDTVHIDSIDVDDETIQSINSIELTIESINKIPVGIEMQGEVLDINNEPLFSFPPSYSPDTKLVIPAPTVDSNGDVISAGNSKQVILLKGEDARTFIDNPNISFTFKLSTPPDNSIAPVKFRDTDEFYYKIYGKLNYRVSND